MKFLQESKKKKDDFQHASIPLLVFFSTGEASPAADWRAALENPSWEAALAAHLVKGFFSLYGKCLSLAMLLIQQLLLFFDAFLLP